MARVTMVECEAQKPVTTPPVDAWGHPRAEQLDTLDILHLSSLMQAPALIALLHGPDHVYQFVNERYVQVIGDRRYSGRPVRDAVPEAVDQGLVAILDRVFATGEPFVATEMPLQFSQGTAGTLQEGFYNFIYQPLADESGRVLGIMVHAVDVTDQVRTRHQLERLAAEHTATLSQMADGVMIVDTSGCITFQNEAARRLLGVDAVGLSLEAFLDQIQILSLDGAPLAPEATWLARTVQGGVSNLDVQCRIRRPGAAEIFVHGSATPVITEDGSRYGSVFTFRDITEHERMERDRARYQQELTIRVLQAQEDERKRIARELHDETLQDLTTLLINLDVAERRISNTGGEQGNALARVRAIASRALDETRALAHSLRPPILDDVGLTAALDALGEEYSQTYRLDVVVEAEVSAEGTAHLAPYLETVVFRIAQEALTNACKHAGGSEIRICFELSERMATLSVTDNGHGFDLHQMSAIGRHSGLGLEGMRERAALVGGDLHIATAPGQGTLVTFVVPLNQGQIQSPIDQGSGGQKQERGASAIRVLLVDDHAMLREGLKAILEAQPGICVVGEGEDGRQALEMVEQLHPDVVVMDIAMPNLNGFDATRQIKRRFPEVKVLILTSHENRQYVTQIVKTGAEGCLLKRSAGTELVTSLKTLQAGGRYVSPSIAGTLLDDYRVRIDHGGDDLLTEREREVVQLAAEGHTNRGISRKLGISVKTVETHRTNIMEKLGATDRTDLVKYAIRSGMISPE